MLLLSNDTPYFDSVQMVLRRPCAAGTKLLADSAFQKDHRLVVEGTATHAGLIINRRVYRPYRVKDAARTMYDPAPVPIVEGHMPTDWSAKDDCRAMGTIQLAQYIDTRRGRPEDSAITKWDGDPHANSLGHLRYYGYVSDAEAIPRVLDGRLNRQSVGFYTDQMCDSITGIDLYKADYDDWPEHVKECKSEVDGKPVYMVPGQLNYYHLAFTDEPADPWAGIDAFKSAPSEIQETKGTFQLYAQDSADGLIYDMTDPDAIKHFRKPIWALGFDFDSRRRAEVDRIRQEKISAASKTGGSPKTETDSLPNPDLSSKDGEETPAAGATATSEPATDTSATEPSQTVPAVDGKPDGARSEGDREVPKHNEEATMDKILELIRDLGKGSDQIISDLIVALDVTDEQLRSLEPVAKILKTDSEAAAAAQTTAVEEVKAQAKTETDRLAGELKGATDKLAEHEAKRKSQLVDRVYNIQVALDAFKAAEIDSEDKVKALKEGLAKQSTDALEFSLQNLERLHGGPVTDTVSVIPKKSGKGERASEQDSASTPRFMKLRG